MTHVAHPPFCAAVLMALLGRQQQPHCKVSRPGSGWQHLTSQHTTRQAQCVAVSHHTCHHSVRARHVPYQHCKARCCHVSLRTGAAGVRWRDTASSSGAAADAASSTAAAEVSAGVRQPAWGPGMPPGQEDHLLLRQPAYVAALPAQPRLSEECRREELQGEQQRQ
jgi:hypothetical protein